MKSLIVLSPIVLSEFDYLTLSRIVDLDARSGTADLDLSKIKQ